jgi:MFS family permease
MSAPAVRTRYAWYVVGVLLLLNASSFIDRQVMFLLNTPIKEDLGLTDTEMGWLLGPAFATTFAFSVFLMGRLADRRSRPAIIAWGGGVERDVHGERGGEYIRTALCVEGGVGIGEATFARWRFADRGLFPTGETGHGDECVTSGVFIGSGLAYLIGGTVIEAVSNLEPWHLPLLGEIRDWQRVFILVGLPGCCLPCSP